MDTLTQLPAWQALVKHRHSWEGRSLRAAFAADPDRFARFSVEFDGLLFDYSKQLVDAETLPLLCELARVRKLACSGGRDAHLHLDLAEVTERR